MQQKIDSFTSAMDAFIRRIEALGEPEAQRKPADGGWSPAQIGWHVATTNHMLAGGLTGDVPLAAPVPDNFRPDPDVFSKIPPKIETFPQLQPPAVVTRTEALDNLRASIKPLVDAFASLTEARATGFFVQLPMGPLTMYQFADFAVGHIPRHMAQLERAIA